MKKLRKLRNNLVSMQAMSVLGLRNYARLLKEAVANVPQIVKSGDLRPLDKKMGAYIGDFNYRGRSFKFDCGYCDRNLREDSFGFGIAREIYIRDCYFKYQPDHIFPESKIVLDLGANRGAFSSMMTSVAESILCVECSENYQDVIRHNMEINDFKVFSIETVFLGRSGAKYNASHSTIKLNQLIDKHHINRIDFIKMDIEGSEFEIFEDAGWLDMTKALSMEVHPQFGGNTSNVIETLKGKNFVLRMADDNLREVSEVFHAAYIYAWKK